MWALIDVGVEDELFKGSRAVWNTSKIKEVFSTVARPEFINHNMETVPGLYHGEEIRSRV